MSEPVVPVPDQAQGPEQTATFKGTAFRLNPDVSEFAFMEFAEAADAGEDGATLTGMASLLRFAVELVHPDEQARFRALCRREHATSDDLVEFLLGKSAVDAERPTGRSSDSSDGPTGIAPSSAANSDGRGLLASGPAFLRDRPDLALVVVESQRHEARRAS